ncbi:hypothetical protein CDD83_7322 [Cordyceps sp. RAO-2017]|nr:hypothetical protein CDD83_7322 [Cordyceps sp. RAO-2017]
MLPWSCRSSVCRQCLSRASGICRALASGSADGSQAAATRPVHPARSRRRLFSQLVSQARQPVLYPPEPSVSAKSELEIELQKLPSSDDSVEQPPVPSIRDVLRQWELEHGDQFPKDLPMDMPAPDELANTLNRTQSSGLSAMDQVDISDSSFGESASGEDEEAVVAAEPRKPGELVELSQNGSRVPVLAVFLGSFGGRNHFWAANGKWVIALGFPTTFSLPHFASPSEMQPVQAKIPPAATPEEYEDMRRNDRGPTREDGAALIDSLAKFRSMSAAAYQVHVSVLDRAEVLLSRPDEADYLSLVELADKLLPSTLKGPHGFPAHALYAVHRALKKNENAFRLLHNSGDCQRPDHLYEIFPQNVSAVIHKIAAMTHEYTEARSRCGERFKQRHLVKLTMGQFVLQARKAVSASRQTREYSPHGTLKPSAGVELPRTNWCQAGKDILKFLEWWAGYGMFDTASHLNAYGALILRAINMYDDTDLDQGTAWTFLQEVGIIAPWEVRSRYKIRLPGVSVERGAGLGRQTPKDLVGSTRADIAAGARTDRRAETTYCIDSPSTVIIDDGVSLERTAEPDEFWIHVLVADPGSVIKPHSELSKFLELLPQTVFLPGHYQAMMPAELGNDDADGYKSGSIVKQFSLVGGGPALSFSARVNGAGDVLDYKVEPATLGDVLYLDPKDVAAFCDEPPSPLPADKALVVGSPPEQGPPAPERPMAAIEDLTEASKQDLSTLYRLAEALRRKRLLKGAWPFFVPRPSVSVAFGTAPEASLPAATALPADPYIEVSREPSGGCSVVGNLMVLAGEIAARWCSSRNVPVPYRRDVKTATNFDAAFAYATGELYPAILRGIEPSKSQLERLMAITGGVELATQPGPSFILGLDMYVKATSPLRRFADLLVHWQIHAALAYERKVNRRIDPSVDKLDDILPFTAGGLNLPLLRMRERMTRSMSNAPDWIVLALVRAWAFEARAPPPLQFTVDGRFGRRLIGRLDLFGLKATMDVLGLAHCRLLADVRAGDQFEVELAEVNVHSGRIAVRARRSLGRDGDADGAHPPTSSPHIGGGDGAGERGTGPTTELGPVLT